MEEEGEALSVPQTEGSRKKQEQPREGRTEQRVDHSLMREPHPSSSAAKPLELTSVSPSYFTRTLLWAWGTIEVTGLNGQVAQVLHKVKIAETWSSVLSFLPLLVSPGLPPLPTF